MHLVIVESPSKAKTINKYLGPDYKVISSVGHVVDLPKSKLGVDITNNYEPMYQVIKGKESVIEEIRKLTRDAENVILATDPDREGEAIAWHIKNLIIGLNKDVKRIVFHEITESAILKAIQNQRDIDQNLVDAQQARRILDRLVGYSLSPFLWKKIRYGLSAGRVQSVALRLIVDRELERQNFKSEEYWSCHVLPSFSYVDTSSVKAFYSDQNRPDLNEDTFVLTLKKINGQTARIRNQEEFERISRVITQNTFKVHRITDRKVVKKPHPPFTTATFQQAAVNVLGMSAKSAMRSAQKLYENGLITYMRTDSVYVSDIAINAARKLIKELYGDPYLPDKVHQFKNKAKLAQEAHEAIRPTDFRVRKLPKLFSTQDQKVYDLIYRRALASQMREAVFLQKTVVVVSELHDEQIQTLEFSATATKCEFDGWLKLYDTSQDTKTLELIDAISDNAVLYPYEVWGYQHFTQPPARYTEASLIKDLEKYGIGRPSTYATILSVILERDYVKKDGKYLYPTETGIVVVNMLKQHFNEIVDIEFTARMEDRLDDIAAGKIGWQPMIDQFFRPFSDKLEQKEKEINKEDLVILGQSNETCDLCGKPMLKKLGKYGVFLSCIDFPKCKGIKSLSYESPDNQKLVDGETLDSKYKPAPKTEDGRDFVLKQGRFGRFWAHPDYPKVKITKPLELTDDAIEKMFGKPPIASDGQKMILRKGRFGYFWAHPNYPDIKEIQKAKQKKQDEVVN
ncbi:MAG: DNA topoisomerase 1 [Candidatus Dojkabacteria bacterium]|nr:MAG: DNA topoisomerase 1 [Candidatus Dojkabacteria bacterium]